MNSLIKIFEIIKKDFCNLTDFKIRGETIEIITPFATINDKLVSVFIKKIDNKYIISDGGWIDLNTYNVDRDESSEDIIKRILSYYSQSYDIKYTTDRKGILYYYKICNNKNNLSSKVFDVANFIVGIVNSLDIQYKDEKDEKEVELFRKKANNFLSSNYKGNVKFKVPLDDYKNIRFNAIIYSSSTELNLITYVTGSTPYSFENALSKNIVNFEIAQKSRYSNYIKNRISILNDSADGYKPEKSSSIINLLNEKTTIEPIKWSNKERLLEYI